MLKFFCDIRTPKIRLHKLVVWGTEGQLTASFKWETKPVEGVVAKNLKADPAGGRGFGGFVSRAASHRWSFGKANSHWPDLRPWWQHL